MRLAGGGNNKRHGLVIGNQNSAPNMWALGVLL